MKHHSGLAVASCSTCSPQSSSFAASGSGARNASPSRAAALRRISQCSAFSGGHRGRTSAKSPPPHSGPPGSGGCWSSSRRHTVAAGPRDPDGVR